MKLSTIQPGIILGLTLIQSYTAMVYAKPMAIPRPAPVGYPNGNAVAIAVPVEESAPVVLQIDSNFRSSLIEAKRDQVKDNGSFDDYGGNEDDDSDKTSATTANAATTEKDTETATAAATATATAATNTVTAVAPTDSDFVETVVETAQETVQTTQPLYTRTVTGTSIVVTTAPTNTITANAGTTVTAQSPTTVWWTPETTLWIDTESSTVNTEPDTTETIYATPSTINRTTVTTTNTNYNTVTGRDTNSNELTKAATTVTVTTGTDTTGTDTTSAWWTPSTTVWWTPSVTVWWTPSTTDTSSNLKSGSSLISLSSKSTKVPTRVVTSTSFSTEVISSTVTTQFEASYFTNGVTYLTTIERTYISESTKVYSVKTVATLTGTANAANNNYNVFKNLNIGHDNQNSFKLFNTLFILFSLILPALLLI